VGVIMVSKRFLSGALATILAVTPALAADGQAKLTAATGRVLVNQGDGFHPAATGKLLNTGDSIFIGDESAATIVYATDNCQVVANAPRVLTIGTLSPCQTKTVQIEPAADLPQEPEAQAYVPGGFAVPVGLIVAAGVVGACIAFCDEIGDDDDDEEMITGQN
jgi:hypothetical protein